MFGQSGSMTFPMTYDYDYDGFYSSKKSGWKSLSSLEKSLSIALGIVSVLAIALMIAVIIVGVKLNEDNYKAPEKITEKTIIPPWISTLLTSTTPVASEVTTRIRPTTILTSTTPITANETENSNFCETEHCRRILSFIDESQDPCTNFYKFACGGWEMKNIASNGSPIIDQFIRMEESFKLEIKEILESGNELDLDAADIAREFYQSCLNDTVEEDNSRSLRQLIDDLTSVVENKSQLIPILATIRRELSGNYIYGIEINVHLEDALRNAIYLKSPNFDLPSDNFYASNYWDRFTSYRDFMIYLWNHTFPEHGSTVTTQVVDSIIQLEQKLQYISFLNKAEDLNPSFRIIQRNNHAGNYYKEPLLFINSTLLLLQESHNEVFFNDLDVIIENINYYSEIQAVLDETALNTILNYLKWRVMLDFGRHSNDKLRVLYEQKLLRLKKPRWEMCVEETIKYFGPPLIAIYIQNNVVHPSEFKQQVFDFGNYLKQTVLKLMDKVSWIASNASNPLLPLMQEKLEQLQIFALYPLSLVDENITSSLNYYAELNLTNSSSHFQNMMDLTKWHSDSDLKLVWTDVNETVSRIELTAQTSNKIFYNKFTNSLYLPTAAFRPPIYDFNGSIAFNYGSMGTLIGSSFIEALERTFVEYVNGTSLYEWDSKTLQNLHSVIDCIKGKYSSVYNETNSTMMDEEKKLKANIIDVGGLQIALKSIFEYTQVLLDDHKILDYSPQQLFFIGFAQDYCTSYTNDRFLQEMSESEVSVSYRVNAMLSFVAEDFSTAWSCPGVTNACEK